MKSRRRINSLLRRFGIILAVTLLASVILSGLGLAGYPNMSFWSLLRVERAERAAAPGRYLDT